MIKSIKNKMFLFFLLLLASTTFASDKPVWTIDHKKLNLPEIGKPVSYNKWVTEGLYDKPDPNFKVHFTLDNKILVSFLHYRPQTELKPNDKVKKFDTFFVSLLLSKENGELIRRVEWPLGESTQIQRLGYGSCMYPLPLGGYVGIINQHLQLFDSSFNVIDDRVLNTLEPGGGMYYIIVPLSGKFIILMRQKSVTQFEKIIEIINADTFETMEQLEIPSFGMIDIWEDRLLSISYEHQLIEKKIAALQWDDLGLDESNITNNTARFIYNGAIVAKGLIRRSPEEKRFLVMIEDGKKSAPVFDGCMSKPSMSTPVVVCRESKLSEIRDILDLSGKNWIAIYDLNTRQVLLATKEYSAADMIDYAISPDGSSILVMTEKKIELYNVNFKKDKKK